MYIHHPNCLPNKVSIFQDFYNTADTNSYGNPNRLKYIVYVDDTVWGDATVNTVFKKLGDLNSKNTAPKMFKVSLVLPPVTPSYKYYNYYPGFDRKAPPDPSKVLVEKMFYLSGQGNTSVYIIYDNDFQKFRLESFFTDGYQIPSIGKFKLRVLNLARKIIGPDPQPVGQPVQFRFFDKSPIPGLPSSIAYGQLTDYVELPADYYQFRLLDESNNILSFPISGGSPSSLFNAGNVYTLVIRNSSFVDENNTIVTSYTTEFKKDYGGVLGTSDSTIAKVQLVNADYTHVMVNANLNGTSATKLAFGQGTSALDAILGQQRDQFYRQLWAGHHK